MPLGKVMDRIWEKENGGEAVSHKLPDAELKNYFTEMLPEYDRTRVYTSDIKKVLHWYNILHKLNLLVKEEEPKAETEAESETEVKPKAKAGAAKKEGAKAGSANKSTKKKATGKE